MCIPRFAWVSKLEFFLTQSQQSYKAVMFSNLSPTGWLLHVASLLLPLTQPNLNMMLGMQHLVSSLSPNQVEKLPATPAAGCSFSLVSIGSLPPGQQSPAQGMGRESHPPRKYVATPPLTNLICPEFRAALCLLLFWV